MNRSGPARSERSVLAVLHEKASIVTNQKIPVALVNMPFSYSKYPSIQLGTLSALLKSKGVGVECHHLNVRFAQKIGVPLYELICEKRALFGEWLFSYLLFRDNPKRAEYPTTFKPLFEQISQQTGHGRSYFEDMATRIAPQFLTWAMTAIDWGQYRIVGFTSTFDQNVASLTLAKLIKDLYPDVRIVFGGANYDGEMGLEYFRAFPFIDHVVVGEGEDTFPALVAQLMAGDAGPYPKGVTYRENGRIRFEPNPSLFTDFVRTGPPDYDDYYHLLAELGADSHMGSRSHPALRGLARMLVGREASLHLLRSECAEHEVPCQVGGTGGSGTGLPLQPVRQLAVSTGR